MANRSFQSFGKENIGEFTKLKSLTFSYLEFGFVKYWRMTFVSPNLPVSPLEILHYSFSIYLAGALHNSAIAIPCM